MQKFFSRWKWTAICDTLLSKVRHFLLDTRYSLRHFRRLDPPILPLFLSNSECLYRKDTQNSTTLSQSTQHLCTDTFKSNLRRFHSRHQIFGISVNLEIFIFELVMKIVHYNENDVIVNIILNKQQKWIDFTKTQTKHYCHSNGVRH